MHVHRRLLPRPSPASIRLVESPCDRDDASFELSRSTKARDSSTTHSLKNHNTEFPKLIEERRCQNCVPHSRIHGAVAYRCELPVSRSCRVLSGARAYAGKPVLPRSFHFRARIGVLREHAFASSTGHDSFSRVGFGSAPCSSYKSQYQKGEQDDASWFGRAIHSNEPALPMGHSEVIWKAKKIDCFDLRRCSAPGYEKRSRSTRVPIGGVGAI